MGERAAVAKINGVSAALRESFVSCDTVLIKVCALVIEYPLELQD